MKLGRVVKWFKVGRLGCERKERLGGENTAYIRVIAVVSLSKLTAITLSAHTPPFK